jgi:protein phosphatase methylesterase 1
MSFHQDKPAKLATVLVEFWRRNTTTLVLPPKMGSTAAAQQLKMVGDA